MRELHSSLVRGRAPPSPVVPVPSVLRSRVDDAQRTVVKVACTMRAVVCAILMSGLSALPHVAGLIVVLSTCTTRCTRAGCTGPAPTLCSLRACAHGTHTHIHGRGPAAARNDDSSRRRAASLAVLWLVCAFARPNSAPAAIRDAEADDEDDANSTAHSDGAARQAEAVRHHTVGKKRRECNDECKAMIKARRELVRQSKTTSSRQEVRLCVTDQSFVRPAVLVKTRARHSLPCCKHAYHTQTRARSHEHMFCHKA